MIVFAYTLLGLHLKVRLKGNYYVVGAMETDVILFLPPQMQNGSENAFSVLTIVKAEVMKLLRFVEKCCLSRSPPPTPDRSRAYMPGPTLLFIGPFDQLPRKAESDGGRERGRQPKVGCGSSGGQESKTQDRRPRETSDFKIDVLTFRPRASIFVQTVVIEENPRDQVRVAS